MKSKIFQNPKRLCARKKEKSTKSMEKSENSMRRPVQCHVSATVFLYDMNLPCMYYVMCDRYDICMIYVRFLLFHNRYTCTLNSSTPIPHRTSSSTVQPRCVSRRYMMYISSARHWVGQDFRIIVHFHTHSLFPFFIINPHGFIRL